MSAEAASAKTNLVEPSAPLASPYGLAMPTGYRVAVVPGAIEVTGRLVEPNEVRNLMKVLGAGCIILEETTDGDLDKPLNLTRPLPRVSAVPSGKPSTR
jgi:hypothetical protein